ncbi:MAG: DUF3014 domain-containing protein [Vicinamibacterales bacterium]
MLDDASDYELQTDEPPLPEETRSPIRWIIAAVVIAAVGGAAWFYFSGRQAQPAPQAQSEAATPVPVERPLGGQVDAIELPPLAETDPLVRQLVRGLSSHPVIAAWLATGGLLRSFTVAVDNIADGATPAPRLRMVRPTDRFRVIDREDGVLIDSRTYARYTPLAAAVDSLDADGVARLYATLKPRIEDAYAELGRGRSFDVALETAIVALLRTPAVDGDIRLVPMGAVSYGFADPRLERLTPAQKQLARMGPRNVRVIQDKLRQIAAALGIPGERLPR